jgi:hypothetical protein
LQRENRAGERRERENDEDCNPEQLRLADFERRRAAHEQEPSREQRYDDENDYWDERSPIDFEDALVFYEDFEGEVREASEKHREQGDRQPVLLRELRELRESVQQKNTFSFEAFSPTAFLRRPL